MAATITLSPKPLVPRRKSKTEKPVKVKAKSSLKLVDIMVALMAIEFIAGGIILAREIIEQRKVREQITQISKFDAAVTVFYDKYMGLPGDLLSAQAERVGLPTGDGTPAHSDGDGKLSPCSPGWREGLGCETGLFWAQLASTELIEGSYTANIRYADNRVQETDLLQYYIPASSLSADMYFFVWNADHSRFLSNRYVPNGNYYQLTLMKGIEDGKVQDDNHAISPLMAKEIDQKLDDGYPFSGKIIVNGKANVEDEGWERYATTDPLECVTDDEVYNTREYFKAHRALCHLAIAIQGTSE